MERRNLRRASSPFLVLTVLLTFAACLQSQSCGGVTTQDVQEGIDIAADVLSVLTTVLKPAVETSSKLCDQLIKDDSPVKEKALTECAQINDAWNHVEDLNAQFQAAVAEGNKTRAGTTERSDAKANVDAAMAKLKQAVEELQNVLAESTLVTGGAP